MNYLPSTHGGQMIEFGKFIYHFKSLNADGTKYWRCKNQEQGKVSSHSNNQRRASLRPKHKHKSKAECQSSEAKIAMIKCAESIKHCAKTSTSSMKKMFDKQVNAAIKDSGLETKDFATVQLDFYGLKKPCIRTGI